MIFFVAFTNRLSKYEEFHLLASSLSYHEKAIIQNTKMTKRVTPETLQMTPMLKPFL